MSTFSDLLTSLWMGIVGLGLAILSIAFDIYFFVEGRRKRVPLYTARTSIICNPKGRFESLKIFYGQEQVEDLFLTKVALWNAGRESIRAQDISSGDPLTIRMESNGEILDAELLKQSDPANRFGILRQDRRQVGCGFEYMDRAQGAVFQVIHTGEGPLTLSGTVIGAGKFLCRLPRREGPTLTHFMVGFEAVFLLYIIIAFWYESTFLAQPRLCLLATLGIGCYLENLADIVIFAFILCVTALVSFRYLKLFTVLPKGLGEFWHESGAGEK